MITVSTPCTDVLFISHSTSLGGAEQSLYSLVTSLDTTEHTPLVCFPQRGPFSQRLSLTDIDYVITPMPPWRRVANLIPRYLALHRLDFRLPPVDLIHCNTIWSAPYADALARRRGISWICHVRDIVTPQQAVKYHLRRAAQVIAISEAVRMPLERAGDLAITTVYNGVEISRFRDARPLRIAPEGSVSVGILGQLVPGCRWKGYDTFLQAAAEVPAPAHFLIIGGDTRSPEAHDYGSYREELRALSRSLGLADRVTFTGFREDVHAVIAGLDIVVNASWAEPFGRTIIEAMAAGKPVIGTEAGGALEIILPGHTGLLVPPRDPHRLAEAIQHLVSAPEQRRRMGEAGQQRAREHFSLDALVRRITRIYREVVSHA